MLPLLSHILLFPFLPPHPPPHQVGRRFVFRPPGWVAQLWSCWSHFHLRSLAPVPPPPPHRCLLPFNRPLTIALPLLHPFISCPFSSFPFLSLTHRADRRRHASPRQRVKMLPSLILSVDETYVRASVFHARAKKQQR